MWCIYTEVISRPRKKMNRIVGWKVEIPRNYHTRQSKSGAERQYCISPLSFVGSRAFVTIENIYSNVCVCHKYVVENRRDTQGGEEIGWEGKGGQRPKEGGEEREKLFEVYGTQKRDYLWHQEH